MTVKPEMKESYLLERSEQFIRGVRRSLAQRRLPSLGFKACIMICFLCSTVLPQSVHPKSQQVGQKAGDGEQPGARSTAMPASLNRAVAALEKGELVEAERSARAAVAEVPRSPAAHNVLGVALDRLGRADEALAEFSTAVKLDPSFIGARNNIGRLLAGRGKKAEAIAEFENILKIQPSHLQAHYNLGALYAGEGNFGKAAEQFSQALRLAPDDLQLELAFLNVAYRADRMAEADATAEIAERTVGSDPRGLFSLSTILAQSKQYERAVRLFLRLNDLQPHTYEVLYNLGIAYYNLDRNEDAARYLAEACDLNPAPAETHFRLGLIASEQSDHANAVLEFKHAIERRPQDANFHYLLGREYFRVGFWEGAINEFTQTIEVDPNQAPYYLARADANYRKGEAAAAASDFDRAAQLDPKIENVEYWQGYTYRAAGVFDVARKHLENFISKNPDHVDALASLGFVAIEQGDLDLAEGWLQRALKIDRRNVVVLYDYARISFKRREYVEAAKRLEDLIAVSPAYTQAYYQLFLSYTRLKQPEKAQTALATFKRLDALERQTKQERILDDKVRTQQMLGLSPQ